MMKVNTRSWLVAAVLAVLCSGCATNLPAPDFQALVASPDRSEADRSNDARRKPAELLEFYGVRPGMTVLDLGAGAGYNTELLARAVGASGRVYAQNTRSIVDNMLKGRFDERLQKPVMKNVALRSSWSSSSSSFGVPTRAETSKARVLPLLLESTVPSVPATERNSCSVIS